MFDVKRANFDVAKVCYVLSIVILKTYQICVNDPEKAQFWPKVISCRQFGALLGDWNTVWALNLQISGHRNTSFSLSCRPRTKGNTAKRWTFSHLQYLAF